MADGFTESFLNQTTWEAIAIAASAFSVFGAAILIMLSRLFELRNLEQIAKAEFVFAASSILIVLMSISIFDVIEPALTNSLAKELYLFSVNAPPGALPPDLPGTGMPPQTMLDYVKLYMASPMLCVKDFMFILYLISIPVEAMASLFMEIFMSEHASGFGFKWISERITNTTQLLTFYTYIYYLLVHMIDFIEYYAGFFFSVGVILRAFPPTRGAGGYVMALTIGLYFIFPLTYIISSAVAMPHAQSNMMQVTDHGSSDFDGFYTCALPQVPGSLRFSGCGMESASSVMRIRSILDVNYSLITDLLTVHITEITRHLISAICIFPMIAFVVLLTFVLNTSNLFGGNIPEIGRGLVRLI
jgi:hypothetical protein